MFSTLRTRFGIPGVISVIALVFAMFGGAYAATNSSGGGHTATASAKAKKGPRGPKGATGPAGPQGSAGSQGPAGANGKDGAPGQNGAPGAPGAAGHSVVLVNEAPPGCTEGGFTYEVEGSGEENEVCNGEKGVLQPGETLCSECTETGAWSFGPLPVGTLTSSATGGVSVPISFPIELAGELDAAHVHYVTKAEQEASTVPAACSAGATKGSAKAPLAASGNLCVFEGGLGFAHPISNNIRKIGPAEFGASTAGAYLLFQGEEESTGRGSFAVTG